MKPAFRPNFKELIDPSLLIVIAILLLLGAILAMFFIDKVKNYKTEYKTKYYIYLFSSILVFTLVAFLGHSRAINTLFGEFVFYQVIFFGLGGLHAFVYRTYLDKYGLDNIWLEGVYNLMIAVFGSIPFLLLYTYMNSATYSFVVVSAIVMFLIPTWVYSTFKATVSIPAKIYKTWEFPAFGTFSEPKDDEFRDMVVITFVFYKNPNSIIRTEFRAKSPIRMDFGRLFYHFVNDYNTRNVDSPIDLLDEFGNQQHWVFYLKPNWYGVSKYINPELTMYMNGIQEDSTIICLRTSPQSEEQWQEALA
ncbi:TssN family type VI secretion system protein [Flavobacterium sp. H122]|uniref:TssN family type VI secretion system protein n=1 Tax=Flavobacterium sp. H122 TaxID=2529860 RepID=UPI0010AAE523|nr:TssN family type VI secretion system protein [Flavobacterium sp. H122]